jgi:ParB-like chromosome segregation protein Spo0J
MEQLQIVYLPPGDLTPYEKNARKHAAEDIEAIKKSILEDGFNDPIGIWGDQNTIVEGHGRQIAAMELGLNEVPCIRLDHLTDKQRREYMIRHNRTAELSAWDFQTLEEECAALAIEGQEFPELNFIFTNPNIDDMFAEAEEPEAKEPKQVKCPHCGEWFTP